MLFKEFDIGNYNDVRKKKIIIEKLFKDFQITSIISNNPHQNQLYKLLFSGN